MTAHYFYGCQVFLLRHSPRQISSILSCWAISPSAAVLILGFLSNPHGSSIQPPWAPEDQRPCSRYIRPWYGLSVWFHSTWTVTDQLLHSKSLKCLPSAQPIALNARISPLLQLPDPLVQTGSACFPSSFFPLF